MNNLEELNKNKKDTNNKLQLHSPAQLAFAGDAVYEMLVRAYIVEKFDYNVNKMHREAIKFVKAASQAKFIKELDEVLTEDEKKIVKRGRNAKVTSAPKNQDMIDYRYATGFEALFGHLYLKSENERIMFLFDKIINMVYKKDDVK
ncbi:Mini-ribonuclease 3 [Sedimentibacter sp. zth1]|uniref:Mini-ribonuclease 3 n=1 Tax=Sedimentibacter sp. zth1 TaxID=2816908 RepID=UPI001A912143|nr:ribonuclease III domain-containing protein [Sedimentibacter sp. zth1]QSX05966.1 Mini-ribonuclease 3 [Sedimentibacter sp. zth1]